jgi:D-amino-acid dehydrogenase
MSGRTVAILGGGVIGLCSAWYAMREGFRVIVIERDGPNDDRCSLGNAGLISPSHFVPLAAPGVARMAFRSFLDPRSPLRLHPRLDLDYLRWCWRFWRSSNPRHVARASPALRDLAVLSRRCYDELAEEWRNPFALQKRGLLMLCRTQHGLDEEAETAEAAHAIGMDAHVLSAAQTAELEPALRMSITGAVHYPLDAHLIPQALVAEITRRLQEAGVEFIWSTEATGFRTRGERVEAIVTNQDEIRADHAVITGGVWSMGIAQRLGIDLPLQAGKGYNLTLRQPRALPTISAILSEARIAMTPMGQTLRFAGTLELAGLDQRIDWRRVHALIEAIPKYFPEFTAHDFDGVQPWAGLRPCSPDGLPYIGRSRDYDNVLVAAGHAMLGVTLAPATGLVISELLAGHKTSAPLEQFAPDRFT